MFIRNARSQVVSLGPTPGNRPGKRYYGNQGNQSNELSLLMMQPEEENEVIPKKKEFATLQQLRQSLDIDSQGKPKLVIDQEQVRSQIANLPPSRELEGLIDIKIQILNQQKSRLQDLKQQEQIIKKEISEQEKEIDEILQDLDKLSKGAQMSPLKDVKAEQPNLKSHQQRVNSQQDRNQIPVIQERQTMSRAKNAFYGLTPHANQNPQLQQIQPSVQPKEIPNYADKQAEMRKNK